MHLVNCKDPSRLYLEEFNTDGEIPPYAILSHTWSAKDSDEVTFQDMESGTGESKPGYDKIKFCANRARKDELDYFWVDSCCIDKTKSQILLEAINSMFAWYRRSTKCYVYLADIKSDWLAYRERFSIDEKMPSYLEGAIRANRWFTRGWTLQELLAANIVEFFDGSGSYIGNKGTLVRLIHQITGIDIRALAGFPLSAFSVEERFHWAEERKTKRPEDRAYSLLGIFGVRMWLDYGEGEASAFARLQKKIQKLEAAKSSSSNSQLSTSEVPQQLARSHFRMVTLHFLKAFSNPFTIASKGMETLMHETDPKSASMTEVLDLYRVMSEDERPRESYEVAVEQNFDWVSKYRLLACQKRHVSAHGARRWGGIGKIHVKVDFLFAAPEGTEYTILDDRNKWPIRRTIVP